MARSSRSGPPQAGRCRLSSRERPSAGPGKSIAYPGSSGNPSDRAEIAEVERAVGSVGHVQPTVDLVTHQCDLQRLDPVVGRRGQSGPAQLASVHVTEEQVVFEL